MTPWERPGALRVKAHDGPAPARRARRPEAAPHSSAESRRACRRAFGPAMLPEQLTAAAARHQDGSRSVDAGKATSRPPPLAWSAETSPHSAQRVAPYGGVLDVATSHYPSVVDQCRRTDRKVRVRRMHAWLHSAAARRTAGPSQPVTGPSTGSGHMTTSQRMPSAAGGLTRPPARPQR